MVPNGALRPWQNAVRQAVKDLRKSVPKVKSWSWIPNRKDRKEQESFRILGHEAYFYKPNPLASDDRVIFKKRLPFCYVPSVCLRKSAQKVLPIVSAVSHYATNTRDYCKFDLRGSAIYGNSNVLRIFLHICCPYYFDPFVVMLDLSWEEDNTKRLWC